MYTITRYITVKPVVTWCISCHQGIIILEDKDDIEKDTIYTNPFL